MKNSIVRVGLILFSLCFTFIILDAVTSDISYSYILKIRELALLSVLFSVYVIVLYFSRELKYVVLLGLIFRSLFVVLPFLIYSDLISPVIDNYYYSWFIKTILVKKHVPSGTTYSNMPGMFINLIFMYYIIGYSITQSSLILLLTCNVIVFVLYISILRVYLKIQTFSEIFISMFLLIPYEFFIPFYLRTRILAMVFNLLLFYILFFRNKIGPIKSEDLLIGLSIYSITLFINFSYALITIFILLLYLIIKKQELQDTWRYRNRLIPIMVLVSVSKIIYDYFFGKIVGNVFQSILSGLRGVEHIIPSTLYELPLFYRLIGIYIVYGRILLPLLITILLYLLRLLFDKKSFIKKYAMKNIYAFDPIALYPLGFIICTVLFVIIFVLDKNLANSLRGFYYLLFFSPLVIGIMFSPITKKRQKLSVLFVIVVFILNTLTFILTLYSPNLINPSINVFKYKVPLVEISYSDSIYKVYAVKLLEKYLCRDSNIMIISDKNTLTMFIKYFSYKFYHKYTYHDINLLLYSKSIPNRYLVLLCVSNYKCYYNEILQYRIPRVYSLRLISLMGIKSLIYSNCITYLFK